MRRVLLYGLLGGAVIALLEVLEYKHFVHAYPTEIYGGVIAALFAALGVYLGRRWRRAQEPATEAAPSTAAPAPSSPVAAPQIAAPQIARPQVAAPQVAAPPVAAPPVAAPQMAAPPPGQPFVADPAKLRQLGITPRELEILRLIAAGLSNREIGEQVFISENTVKTHSSRLFDKLGVSRRVQAVRRARELGLVP